MTSGLAEVENSDMGSRGTACPDEARLKIFTVYSLLCRTTLSATYWE